MKLKSLLFGSAAVIAAGTGAQAADLPIVEPVEYVRICDAFGAGFYYIPGTDTCLKVGGYVRAESHYVFADDDDDDVVVLFDFPSQDEEPEEFNNWTTRVRGQVNLDARTQTDFGLIRAYIAYDLTVGHDNFIAEETTEFAGPGSYGTEVGLGSAFIQISNDWGTYTAGRTGSFFDFWGDYGWGTRISIEAGTEDTNLFAWTFAGGNGFSFTLSAEDPLSNGRKKNGGDEGYEGQEYPDGVANIRVDQGWGSAQIMGAIRHIHEDDGDGLGFAVGAGIQLGIPGGWEISSQGGYSEGALGYITGVGGFIGDFDGPDGDDTNQAWSIRAGVTGPITANINAWAAASYVDAEDDDGDNEMEWFAAVAGASFSPVPGLVMGPEFGYKSIDLEGPDYAFEGDFDVFGVMWRVQRNF